MNRFLFVCCATSLAILSACTFTGRLPYDFQPQAIPANGLSFQSCSIAYDRLRNTQIVDCDTPAVSSSMIAPIYQTKFMVTDTQYAQKVVFVADDILSEHMVLMVNGSVVEDGLKISREPYQLDAYIMQGENQIQLMLANPVKERDPIVNGRIMADSDLLTVLNWEKLPQIPSITSHWYDPELADQREWDGFSIFHDILGNPTPVVTAPEWIKIGLEVGANLDSMSPNNELLSRTVWQVGATWYRFDFTVDAVNAPMTFRAVLLGNGLAWLNGQPVPIRFDGNIATLSLPPDLLKSGAPNSLIFCLGPNGRSSNITAAEIKYNTPSK